MSRLDARAVSIFQSLRSPIASQRRSLPAPPTTTVAHPIRTRFTPLRVKKQRRQPPAVSKHRSQPPTCESRGELGGKCRRLRFLRTTTSVCLTWKRCQGARYPLRKESDRPCKPTPKLLTVKRLQHTPVKGALQPLQKWVLNFC